jgi:hypothetical protein
VAQIHPIGFTRGNHAKRAAVALPDPFHRPSPPGWCAHTFANLVGFSHPDFGFRIAS